MDVKKNRKMTARYMLFAGDDYYPGGGMRDFVGFFNSIDEANVAGKEEDWHQVVDRETLQRVAGEIWCDDND